MKNKAYYFEQGRKWAMDNAKTANPLALTGSDSWQAKAFQDGINSIIPRGTMKDGAHAIRSHLHCLAKDWKKEYVKKERFDQIKREQRLFTKIKKLCKKHGLEHIAIINGADWPKTV